MNGETDKLMAKQVELSLNYHQKKKKNKKTRLICFYGTVLVLCSYITANCVFNRLSGQITDNKAANRLDGLDAAVINTCCI